LSRSGGWMKRHFTHMADVAGVGARAHLHAHTLRRLRTRG
jgi:hypothetical protein